MNETVSFRRRHPAKRSLGYSCFLLSLVCLLGSRSFRQSCFGAESNQVFRVALGPFTSDDCYVRSVLACRDFAALLQAKLSDVPQVVWVERQEIIHAIDELNMDKLGLLDGAASLRLGKWLRADFLVSGNFSHDQSRRRVLRLEVVEVDHADILAEHTIAIDGDARDPVPVRNIDIDGAVEAIRDGLRQARLRLNQHSGALVLAPLFFRNIDPSPRLDSFESDLLATLAEKSSPSNGVRVLSFPRPRNARGETELVVRGLAAADRSASEKLADAYVWGNYGELKSDGQPFENVPIEVTLNFWTGHGEVHRKVVSGKVGERQALALKVAGECLALLGQNSGKPRSSTTRADMAKWLLDRAAALRETLRSFAAKQGQFLETNEGRNLARQFGDTLELACFFAPENREAQWERVLARSAAYPYGSCSFFESWQHLTDLNDFLTLFPARPDVPADLLLLQNRLNATESFDQQIQYTVNLPIDARDDIVADWRHELQSRITQYKAELEQLRQRDTPPEIPAAANANFARSNPPAHISPSSPRRTLGAVQESDTADTNTPVEIHPVIRTVPVPARCAYLVNTMAEVNHALWVSAEELAEPRLDPKIHKRESVMFRYAPALNTCESISEKIGPHSTVTALLLQSNTLWMTLLFDGVWSMSPDTLETTRFGVENGLVTPNMCAVNRWSTNILFGGVREHRALFAFLTPGSTNWRRLDVTTPLASGPSRRVLYPGIQPSFRQLRLLCFEHWALAGSDPWTLIDLESGASQPLRNLLGIHEEASSGKAEASRPEPVWLHATSQTVCCCAAATDGFWIATSKQLFYLKPGSQAGVEGTLPFETPNAIALDHEYLWLASAPGVNPDFDSLSPSLLNTMFLKYEKESSRIAVFHVPSRTWLSYFVVSGHVSDICCTDRNVYLTRNLSSAPILEVDKSSVLSSQPGK